MARVAKQRFATIGIATIPAMVARMVALALLIPAMLINIDWQAGLASPWNIAAFGMIVGSALFAEAAHRAPTWIGAFGWLAGAALLFTVNVQGAFENSSRHSDHRSDHRKTSMVAAKTQSSQRSQWSQGRTEAAMVAGEVAPTTVEAEIDSLTSKEAGRWRASQECNPLEIKSQATRDFCSEVSKLKAKKAAAERRDELDKKIEGLDTKTLGSEVVTTADPFAENIAALLSLAGIKLDDEQKRVITAQKDLLRSIGLEALATFGPAAWLAMVGMVAAAQHMSTTQPRSENTRTKQEKADMSKPAELKIEPVTAVPAPAVALDDPFHRFVAECIEEAPGVSTPAGEFYKAYGAWCAKNDLTATSQRVFGGKLVERFVRVPNHNRPLYLNIRVKQAAPALRVVSSR